MPHSFSRLSALLLIVLNAACTDTTNPRTHTNPHPKVRYDITLTIENAPGPFDSVEGSLQYDVTNNCVPMTGPVWNRMRMAPRAFPKIVFHKISENLYQSEVYADYFEDEDYFGLGACHWSLTAVFTSLRINKLSFDPYLLSNKLLAQQPVTTYYWRQRYFDNATEGSAWGVSSISKFPPELQGNVFSIMLTPKEASP